MKLPLLFAILACTLQPAFAAVIPVRVATVEQTAHAAERQIPGRIEAIHTVELCCSSWTTPSRALHCVWRRPK